METPNYSQRFGLYTSERYGLSALAGGLLVAAADLGYIPEAVGIPAFLATAFWLGPNAVAAWINERPPKLDQ